MHVGRKLKTMPKNSNPRSSSVPLWRRFVVVVALATPLALYGYLIQLVYEVSARQGVSFKNAGLFFAGILFTSVMYDCIKKVVLLDDRYLKIFSRHFASLYGGVLAMLLGCLLTSFTYARNDKFPIEFPVIAYLVTLVVCVPWIVISLSRAIDSAAKAP